MTTIEKTIFIYAPVETVFRYVAHPANLPHFWRSFTGITNTHRLPTGEQRFDWNYRMVGVRLEGFGEETDFVPHQRLTFMLTGGFHGFITWRFDPEDDGTRVTVWCEMHVPAPLLKKHDAADVGAQNAYDLQQALSQLKTVLEQQSTLVP